MIQTLHRRRFVRNLITPLALAAAPALARAQDWPTRPIRMMSPSAPGGSTDLIARLLGDRLSRSLKVPVVVENRPGGTGSVALDAIAKAAPDGYTVGIGFSGGNIIYPLLNKRLPFNAQRDFTPIGHIGGTGNVLLVHPSVPVKTLPELIAYIKAQPKSQPVNYGSWGNGSGGHLAGESLKIATGLEINHVPYRSASALTTDMIGGHMPIGFLDQSNAGPQAAAGKLRAIAQTGLERNATLPDVPTMAEQGVQFGLAVWFGLFGPAGMPAAIVDRYNAELRAALQAPEVAERLITVIGNKPSPTTPAEFARMIEADWESARRVIEQARITLD